MYNYIIIKIKEIFFFKQQSNLTRKKKMDEKMMFSQKGKTYKNISASQLPYFVNDLYKLT